MNVADYPAPVIIGPANFEPWIELSVTELAAAVGEAPEAPPEQPPPDQQSEQPVLDAAAVAALVAAIAATLLAGGAGLTAAVAAKLRASGFSPNVAAAVAGMVRSADENAKPPGGPGNVARRRTRLGNLARTAFYLVNAARRITGAVRDGTPLATAVSAETGNARSHVAATTSRMDAARRIDEQAAATGATTFRWRAVDDNRTDPECRRLDGRQFALAKPPNGKYPGQVHPGCRCTAETVTTSTNLARETRMNDHEILTNAYADSTATPAAEGSAADAEGAWLREHWPHLFDSDIQRSGKAIRDEAEASKAWSWQRPQDGWDSDGNQAPMGTGRLFDYPAAPPRDPAAERDTEARERAQAWADEYARRNIA